MNETTRQITGTLEIGPLLQLVLDTAVTILNCAAGNLFLVDEATDELVLKVTAGPVTPNLAGLPPPAGMGIDTSDQDGGLDSRFILVVPMLEKENLVGSLEVINRKDGLPFVEDDRNLLSAFGERAAIAIANARHFQKGQSGDETRSEFVTFVGHELKNPLTSIKGYTELLAKGAAGPINEMQANYLGIILSNVERMSTLVSDLNDTSSIDAGRLRLDCKAIELAGVVDEVMLSIERQLEDKQQSVSLEFPVKLPRIWADPTRLSQIITNLLSNANKYTPENGLITIGAEQSANHWDPGGAAQVLHIWVQDNGIGISLEDQNKIFQKYFRADDSPARRSQGSGLGLTITKSLIEMMGGRVWCKSEFHQGTTFHFTLPVAEG